MRTLRSRGAAAAALTTLAAIGLLSTAAPAQAATATFTSTDLAYTGTWASGANSEKATEELNATAKLKGNMTSSGTVGISGLKTPWSGNASVQVDTGTPRTISLYNSGGQTTAEWYTSPTLA